MRSSETIGTVRYVTALGGARIALRASLRSIRHGPRATSEIDVVV